MRLLWNSSRAELSTMGDNLAGSLILVHVECLPDARVSLLVGDDGTLRASAQHLLENFMRFASAEPPPYRPLGCCLARKEISRTMRNDLLGQTEWGLPRDRNKMT